MRHRTGHGRTRAGGRRRTRPPSTDQGTAHPRLLVHTAHVLSGVRIRRSAGDAVTFREGHRVLDTVRYRPTLMLSRLARVWLVATVVVVLAACGAGSAPGADTAGGRLPTHTRDSLPDAGMGGTLAGRVDCLWLENTGSSPRPLVFPSGMTSSRNGDDVIVTDDQGREIARTGDSVSVSGVADPGASSCMAASEASAPWLVGAVDDVCATTDVVERDGECPEP